MEQKEKSLMLTVFGYIRDIRQQNNVNNIPKALIEIIFAFSNTFFKFKENDSNLFKVMDNGWSASFKSGFGCIQIGDFISINDKIIVTIKMKMECDAAFTGIGFITQDFNDYNHGDDFDLKHDNNLMYLYGNGFYKTSKIFDKDLKDTQTFIKYQWFDFEDEISIKINTMTKQAIIWNNIVDINNLHNDEINYVFFCKLPINTDNKVGLIIDMGSQAQTVSIIDEIIDFI